MTCRSLILVNRSILIEQMKGKSYDCREDFISYSEGKVENVYFGTYHFGFIISSENVSTFVKNQKEKLADVAELVFWAERFKNEERPVVALGEIKDFPGTDKPKRVVCLIKRADGKRYLEWYNWNTNWPESTIFLVRE